MKYRADIDGLRAIAVLGVILYHAGFLQFFSSGFMGVDIFFVISGYLITTIIYQEHSEGKFSIATFYERRVRRILPVFLVVLATSLVLSLLFFTPRDFKEFGNSFYSTLIMGANFFFWRDDGYFAAPSHIKPLLHMWSLSVEEQFYIFFPLLLCFLMNRSTKIVKILGYIFLASFIACSVLSFSQSNMTFYLLPFRAWELLIGGIFAVRLIQTGKGIASTPKQAQYLGLLGLALIGLSFTGFIIPEVPFPSFLPLFPCIGTILCIDAGRYTTFSRSLLGTPVLRFIGLLSYSLYLWHWVILVFVRYFFMNEKELSATLIIYSFALMFACSLMTYYFVEQPIRKRRIFVSRKSIFSFCLIASLVLLLITVCFQKGFIKQYFPPHVAQYLAAEENTKVTDINFGDSSQAPTIILLGDSHAGVLRNLFDVLGKESQVSGILAWCDSPLFGAYRARDTENWQKKQEEVKQLVEQHNIKKVVISTRWALAAIGYPETNPGLDIVGYQALDEKGQAVTDNFKALELSLKNTVEYFQEREIAVYIVLPVPEMPWRVPHYASRLALSGLNVKDIATIKYEDYLERQSIILPLLRSYESKNVQLIDPTERFCDGELCYATADGKAHYYDKDHLSNSGALYIKDLFADVFK